MPHPNSPLALFAPVTVVGLPPIIPEQEPYPMPMLHLAYDGPDDNFYNELNKIGGGDANFMAAASQVLPPIIPEQEPYPMPI